MYFMWWIDNIILLYLKIYYSIQIKRFKKLKWWKYNVIMGFYQGKMLKIGSFVKVSLNFVLKDLLFLFLKVVTKMMSQIIILFWFVIF